MPVNESLLLRDLSVVMVVAAAATILFRRLKQPPVLGYLLAGVLIGPHTPPFALVKDQFSIQTMAELGLVFLMFTLGLEFSLPRLRRVGPMALVATLIEVPASVLMGFGIGTLFGWNPLESLILGGIMVSSSSTIIAKVLTDSRLLRSESSDAILGITLLEDVAGVILLTVVSGLAIRSGLEGGEAVTSLFQVVFFVVLFGLAGLTLIPRLIRFVARLGSMETVGVTSLGLCLAGALAALQAGYSTALGAFLTGAILGVTSESSAIADWVRPVRDLFAAIFFVAAGMLLEPRVVTAYAAPIMMVLAAVFIGKTFFVTVGAMTAGLRPATALTTGLTLAQIGEFSFIFGGLALASPGAGNFLFPLAVAVTALTNFATPYLVRFAPAIVGLCARLAPASAVRTLAAYDTWAERLRQLPASPAGTIFSRYLLRLAVYIVLWSAYLLLIGQATAPLARGWVPAIIWCAAYAAAVPLFLAVAYYTNHFLLLALTETAVRLRAGHWLQKIPIHRMYNVSETLLIGGLTLGWFARALWDFPGASGWLAALFGFSALTFAGRHAYRKGYEKLEAFLDHLVGLTTSEPLRLAALTQAGGEVTSEEELMDRIFLEPGSPAVQKHLRAVGLREKTGASIIGIYRRGKLIPNPKPDTVLLAHDLLVILGDPDERAQARSILNNG